MNNGEKKSTDAFNRKRIIQVLNSAKDGHLTAEKLKKLLEVKPRIPGLIPLPWPVEPVTEIKIRTTEEFVYLDYDENPEDRQIPIPGGQGYLNYVPICIAKRKLDKRFSCLDPESHFVISVPEPIIILDIAKYFGEWKIKQIMTEQDFLY